jgi:tetratricopeptide (TPR) repeat protein
LVVAYASLIGGPWGALHSFTDRRWNVILLILVVLAWVLWWTQRGCPFPRTHFDLAWVAWLLTQAAATALSTDSRRGLTPLTLSAIYCLTFYLAVDLLRQSELRVLLPSTLVMVGGVLIVFGLTELGLWYRSWWLIGGWEDPWPPATVRLQSALKSANYLAAQLNLLFPYGAVAWVEAKDRLARTALTLWLAGLVIVHLGTSSRGGWLAAVAGAGVLVGLLEVRQPEWLVELWSCLRRSRVALVVFLVVLIAAALALGALFLVLGQHPTHGPLFHSRQAIWRPVWATFSRLPVWGSGPATYGTQAMKVRSIPPFPLYPHAHSFPLNTLLESGLVGLLALAGLAFAVTRSAVLQWLSLKDGNRARLIASLAALATTAVHSLVDTPQIKPGFCLLIVLILGFMDGFSEQPRRRPWVDLGSRILLGFGAVALVGALLLGLPRYADYARGVALTNEKEYDEAIPLLDRAAAQDPALASNWFQAGYARALIGLGKQDRLNLQQAVSDYCTGLELEPNFSVHWAQLGALLWQLGDEGAARVALQEAVDRAPREAAFVLTVGALEEEMGNMSRAVKLYAQGLELRPEWADSHFFRATALRAKARDAWLDDRPQREERLSDCWTALDEARLAKANTCFLDARALNDPEPYYGLGITSLVAGDLSAAEHHLRVATWIVETSSRAAVPRRAAEFRFALGDVLAQLGELKEATDQYARALRQITGNGPMNRTETLTTWYTHIVFQREAIADHLLPGVVWITITDDEEPRMWQLAEWYEQLGRYEDAARTYRELAEAVPDRPEAAKRADVLLSETGPNWR